jgi:hypothetical protein
MHKCPDCKQACGCRTGDIYCWGCRHCFNRWEERLETVKLPEARMRMPQGKVKTQPTARKA